MIALRQRVAAQLFITSMHAFEAAYGALNAWKTLETPARVQVVLAELEGTKTLPEFIAAMRHVVASGEGRRVR